jgi:hypothetical protein
MAMSAALDILAALEFGARAAGRRRVVPLSAA